MSRPNKIIGDAHRRLTAFTFHIFVIYIKWIHHAKFLGINIDGKLNGHEHIKNIENKTAKSTGMLYTCHHTIIITIQ